MSGVRRLSLLLLLSAAASPAAAQSNVVAPPPPAREDTVGPEQLRDFSLGGNRQQPAETTPPPGRPATPPAPAATQEAPARTTERPAATARPTAPTTSQSTPDVTASAPADTTPSPSAPSTQPGFDLGQTGSAPLSSSPYAPPPSVPVPLETDDDQLPTWPWLLALLAVLGGAAFLFLRRRSSAEASYGQLAFAGGAPAPEPAPAPAPPPVVPPRPRSDPPAKPAQAPTGGGIVSTRLRAWLDIEVSVRAAVLTEQDLQLQIDILITNSGSAPARDVAVEAVILNGGPQQDKELARFFGRPDATTAAAESLAPYGQLPLQTVVKLPKEQWQEYAAGDRRLLIPVVALNAGYRAGSGQGRTSAAFLVGRGGGEGGKLGPLRTDQGPRPFPSLEARRLDPGARR